MMTVRGVDRTEVLREGEKEESLKLLLLYFIVPAEYVFFLFCFLIPPQKNVSFVSFYF